MKFGNGGMGMHKHGTSGVPPKNKSLAMARSREVNRALEAKRRASLKKKGKMRTSVKELLEDR